jgi:hypothetical protein
MEDICKRFHERDLHDSKLRSFALVRRKDEDGNILEDMCFEIDLLSWTPERSDYTRAELIFHECVIVMMDLDLGGKLSCSDDIAGANCAIDSDLRKQQLDTHFKYERDYLDDYLHFRIMLVPPGGEINIFAKDFSLNLKQ